MAPSFSSLAALSKKRHLMIGRCDVSPDVIIPEKMEALSALGG
jgi:hypothetical protein